MTFFSVEFDIKPSCHNLQLHTGSPVFSSPHEERVSKCLKMTKLWQVFKMAAEVIQANIHFSGWSCVHCTLNSISHRHPERGREGTDYKSVQCFYPHLQTYISNNQSYVPKLDCPLFPQICLEMCRNPRPVRVKQSEFILILLLFPSVLSELSSDVSTEAANSQTGLWMWSGSPLLLSQRPVLSDSL